MKTIGIDLDDVLLNFNDSFLIFHNSKYGTSVKREEVTDYDLERIWGLNLEEMHVRIDEFYYSKEHEEAPPLEGAVEAITELAKHNTLHIITASPEQVKDEIKMWLEKHFSGIFKHIHFTRKNLFDKSPKKKADICRELGIEMFIEDSLSNAESLAAIDIPTFLLDAPWNQGETSTLVTRVKSWEEILVNFK